MTRRKRPRPAYTPVDDQFIRDHYPAHGAPYCAQHLGRSPSSISNRAARLGIKFTPPPRKKANQRSDRDVQFSRAALMPTSIEELGQKREYPRVQPLGEPCPIHPSNTIGAFGCPACNAGQRWATRQRQTVVRPHHEGGR